MNARLIAAVLTVFLGISGAALAQAAGSDFERLKAGYQRKISEIVTPLQQRLVKDLLHLENTLAKANRLEPALVVREQRLALTLEKEKWKPALAAIPDDPPELERKLSAYDKQLKSAVRPWNAKYVEALKKLKIRKVEAKILNEAVAIEKELERLAAEAVEDRQRMVLEGKAARGNVASNARGAKATAPERAFHLIDGEVTNLERFAAGPVPAEFTVQFDDLYVIDEIKILFWNGEERTYYYKLDVSKDGKKWETLADQSRKGGSGWMTHAFEKRDVRALRIRGLKNSANDRFHIVEVEAR